MKNRKIFLKISLVTIVLGIVVIFVGFNLGGKDFLLNTNINKISGTSINKNSSLVRYREDLEEFNMIKANCNSCDFEIKASSDNNSYVEYYSSNKNEFNIYVENKVLKIENDSDRFLNNFNLHIGVNIDSIKNLLLNGFNYGEFITESKITIYLPKNQIESINLSNEFGNVTFQGINANNVDIILNMGKINLENNKFSYLIVKNNKGDINLKNITTDNKIKIENDMGDVELKNCSAYSCEVSQHMGAIEFEKLDVKSKIKMENNMGSIEGSLVVDKDKNYKVDTKADMGSVSIDDIFKTRIRSEKYIEVDLKTNMGSIELKED